PTDLEPRIRLLIEAWQAQDVALMVRLTEPAQDRSLRRWLRSNVPPSGTDPIDFSITRRDTRAADVLLVLGASSAGGHVLRQRWIEKQGTWFFVPASGPGPQPESRSSLPGRPAPSRQKAQPS